MLEHKRILINGTDERIEKALTQQEMRQEHRFYGGFYDSYRVVMVKHTVYRLMAMMAGYCHEASRYYRSSELAQRMTIGLEFVGKRQKESGLFDYEKCNFEAAPDTAFILKKMLPAYEYMRNHEGFLDQVQIRLLGLMTNIIERGVQGLMEGGFHTPNHRWVIASVLAVAGRFFSNETWKEGARTYLVEGIDCNEDGEFAERSAGNYNRINNDAMLMLSLGLEDEIYEKYAIRNLEMMKVFLEPDGSVFTANSTRFDKDLKIYPKDYYWEYLFLGDKYDRADFIEMASYVLETGLSHGSTPPDFLFHIMNHPQILKVNMPMAKKPTLLGQQYLKDSGIGRYQKEHYTLSVLKDKHNFFYINNGEINLEMKIGGSFFEHRGFKAQEIEMFEEPVEGLSSEVVTGYRMQQVQKGWYYLPFKERQSTIDWWQMDHSKRPMKEGPQLTYEVEVACHEKYVDLKLDISGVEEAPFRVEMAFSGVSMILSDEGIVDKVTGAEALVIHSDYVTVSGSSGKMTIGPAFGEHEFIVGKEDSDVKHPGCPTLYFTDYLPMRRTIRIQLEA